MEAGLCHKAGILQIALAPAAIALQFGQQVRRLLFVATDQIGDEPHVVAGAAHQRCFDEVVRHDAAGHAAGALDRGQSAMLHERLDADDRVVAPIMRFAQLPELHAQREQAARHAGSELLSASMESDVADGLRGGLDDAGGRVGFHQLDHRGQAVAAHYGVGIEHHHVAIVLAPATAEVGNVASLAVRAAGAQAVVHLHLRLVRAGGQCGAEVLPGGALGCGGFRRVAVGQNKHVELLRMAGGGNRFASGAQAGEYCGHVFVADRHDDCRSCFRVHRMARHLLDRQGMFVALDGNIEPHERGHETGHDPAGQQAVKGDLAVFEPDVVVVGLDAGKQRRRDHRADQRQQHERQAPLLGRTLPGKRHFDLLVFLRSFADATGAELDERSGADAVPETAPGAGRHGTAVDRRCCHCVWMALFAQVAALRHHHLGEISSIRNVAVGQHAQLGEFVRLHGYLKSVACRGKRCRQ